MLDFSLLISNPASNLEHYGNITSADATKFNTMLYFFNYIAKYQLILCLDDDS